MKFWFYTNFGWPLLLLLTFDSVGETSTDYNPVVTDIFVHFFIYKGKINLLFLISSNLFNF
jgi:hypothetical protein